MASNHSIDNREESIYGPLTVEFAENDGRFRSVCSVPSVVDLKCSSAFAA
jgi:hypothetical protein